MRKIVCLGVVLMLLFCAFAGCEQNDPAKNTTVNGDVTTNGTGGQPISGTNGQQESLPATNSQPDTPPDTQPSVPAVVVPPTTPQDPGNTVIPFDPDREIYILCGENYYTIYGGVSTNKSIGIYIYSKSELDINSISLKLSAQTAYTVSVGELELNGIVDEEQGPTVFREQFSYALYQCYMGKDFAKLWELEKAYKASYVAYFEKYEITMDEYLAAEQAYKSYRDAELESYYLLTTADLPQFYVYYATVNFKRGDVVEETVTEAKLCIEDKSHTLALGTIRLTNERPPYPAPLDWYNDGGEAYDGILGSGNSPLPYNDGIHRIQSYFSFTAEHAMVLTDLQLDNPNHQLVAAWIELAGASGGAIYEKWDMSEPFLVMPGDRVRIHIAYRDNGVNSFSYATKVWGYLIYEWDKGTSCKLSECIVRTASNMNLYEMYALIFEGLDLESYYRDYYYPKYESWRYELDESLVG